MSTHDPCWASKHSAEAWQEEAEINRLAWHASQLALQEALNELKQVCDILHAGEKSAIDAATEVMLALDIAEARLSVVPDLFAALDVVITKAKDMS